MRTTNSTSSIMRFRIPVFASPTSAPSLSEPVTALPSSPLTEFAARKEKVLAMLDETMRLSREFDAMEFGAANQKPDATPTAPSSPEPDALRSAYDNLANDRFHVVVVGEFNRGKSYLINALLGSSILPTGIRPTTAALTNITYGRECRVVIHYHDSLGLPPKIASLNELKQLVTALTPEGEKEAQKVKMAEIFYDSPLCANGVTITDTPGVNDLNEQREEVTYRFIPQSHAAIMVLDATMPLSHSEKRFLEEKILANDIRKIFFVLNKSSLVPPAELPEVESYTRANLEKLPLLAGDVKLYVVDSKEALKAKRDGVRTPQAIEFEKFEHELGEFLVKQHGRLMILTPCYKALRRLSEIQDRIAIIKQMRLMKLEEFLAKEQELTALMNRTRERKELLLDEISRIMQGIYAEVDQAVPQIVDRALFDVEAKAYESSLDVHELGALIKSEFQAAVMRRFDLEVRPKIEERLARVKDVALRDIEITSLQVDDLLVGPESFEVSSVTNDIHGSVPLCTDDLLKLEIGSILGVLLLTGTVLSGIPALMVGIVGAGLVYSLFEGVVVPTEMKKRFLDWWRTQQDELCRRIRDEFSRQIDLLHQRVESQIAPLMDSRLEEVSKAIAEVINLRRATEAEQQRELARLDEFASRIAKVRHEIDAICAECGGENLG